MNMKKTTKIYVAGHRGLVGSAVVRRLHELGYTNLLLPPREDLDLLNTKAVSTFFQKNKPEFVVDSAARVGGIKANMTYPADFLYENLQIQNNLMWAAKNVPVKKFLFLASSCIYPRDCPQPMKEDYFMTGRPEPTNDGYAHAKIAGMELTKHIYDQYGLRFISCMPTNVYGPGDNFDPETSHVLPALIRRIIEAKELEQKEVVVWGTGKSRREFLHVDDLANAIVWLLENYEDKQFLNVGTGEDISIKETAYLIKDIVGYKGKLVFDATKPDGMPKKLLDVSRIHDAGWEHRIAFRDGLISTIDWFMENR
jgi:GDP-L-fucose synthase